MNLGISEKFGFVDYERLTFPTTMRVDWVRVYQDPDAPNIGCDPPDFPTKAYIDEYVISLGGVKICAHADMLACTGTLRRIPIRTSPRGLMTTSSLCPRTNSKAIADVVACSECTLCCVQISLC